MKKNERVLAYTVASVIEQDELQQVSGGASAGMSTRQSVHASAVTLADADMTYDVVADW